MKNEDKIIFAIIAITVVLGLFKKMGSGPTVENIEKAKTEINLSIDQAEKEVLKKEVDNTPVTCECNGTGFIVHGDGHRTPCPAGENCKAKKKTTAMMTASPEEKNGLISFYTLPGCAPCLKWKNEVKPWVEASDWKVEEFTSEDAAPWFEIWINGKPYVYKGFMSKEAFKEIVKNAQK